MPVLPKSADEIVLPKFHPVTQCFPDEFIVDIPKTLQAEFEKESIKTAIAPGSSVALLVGSRGIANLDLIVIHTVKALLRMGARPFIVPAMGSHGGGAAEEQKNIIAGYGITEEAVGVPVKSSMETVIVGHTRTGVPVHVDKYASAADYIVPIARVKAHTDFDGPIESGLLKMLSIGIGKHNGCSRIHQEGFANFPTVLPQVAAIVMKEFSIPFGIAVVENAHEHVHTLEVIPSAEITKREPELLTLSKSLMPRL